MNVTAQLYGQFLVSSQVNYTGTYLADHLDGPTHDDVGYFLKTQPFHPASSGSRCARRWCGVRGATSCSTIRCLTSTTASALSWCATSATATPTA